MQSSTEGVDCSNLDVFKELSALLYERVGCELPLLQEKRIFFYKSRVGLKTSFKKDQGGLDEPRDQRGCFMSPGTRVG